MTPTLGTILIVDDSRTTSATLSGRLKRSGYEVRVADSGEQALQIMAESKFDLVLLDVVLPGIDGLDVLRRIRERYSQFQLPVIMVSSKQDSSDVVHALRLGANDYVVKPYDLSVVTARAATHVVLHQTARSLEQAHEKLETDLSAAAEIQHSQLPPASPCFDGMQASWLYLPCEKLAGDFLNVFELVEGELGFYLMDVTGHGVPAALLSVAVSRTLLPSLDETCFVTTAQRPANPGGGVSLKVTPPVEVVERLNRRFTSSRSVDRLFTILYGTLDGSTGTFRYTSAGHPGPIHLPADGPAVSLPGAGFPIGLVHPDEPTYEYQEHVVELQPGDRVYLFSDGLVDALNFDNQPFGEERLLALLDASRDQSLDECTVSVQRGLSDWCGQVRLDDDISVLGLEFSPE